MSELQMKMVIRNELRRIAEVAKRPLTRSEKMFLTKQLWRIHGFENRAKPLSRA